MQILDEGQYGEDSSTLAEVRAANEELVLNTISAVDLPLSKLTDYYPKKNDVYRSILYALRWQYPVFVNSSTYYGYDIVSPLASVLNNAYLNTAYNHNIDGFNEDMSLYNSSTLEEINSEFSAIYGDYADVFMEMKMEDSRKEETKKEFHNMIPYNILYNVYPRIAYNDEKKSVNVFMLRRPSICDRNGTKLDKHYFEMTSYPECEQPYNLL